MAVFNNFYTAAHSEFLSVKKAGHLTFRTRGNQLYVNISVRGCCTSPNYTNYDKIPSFTLDNRFFLNFTRFPISPIAFTRFYDKFPQLYTNLRRFPNCPKDSPSLRKIRRDCPLLRKIRKIPLFYTHCLQKFLMSTKEVKSKIKLFN